MRVHTTPGRRTGSIAAIAGLLLCSCSAPPESELRLERRRLGSLKLCAFDGVLLAGQPRPEDFAAFKQSGVRTVVTLRREGELPWREENVVRSYGFEYHAVPFAAPGELTDDVFERVRALLSDADRRPLLLHCSSANRVGAVWLAHRVLDGGVGVEMALVEARTVGLKSPQYEQKALDYIARQRVGDGGPGTTGP